MTDAENEDVITDDEDDHSVPLVKPIEAHGKKIKSVTLKEPTGADIMSCGHPMNMRLEEDGRTTMIINTQALGGLISRMAEIPLSSVKAMGAADFQACSNEVMSFFGDIPGAE